MLIQALRAEIYLPESQSLKDKRQVRQSLVQRLRAMNLSVIEAGRADEHKHLLLLLCFAASGESQAREKIGRVLDLFARYSEHVRIEEAALQAEES